MEENHQQFAESSNSRDGGHCDEAIRHHEIRAMMPVEETIEKLYEASKIGSIQNLMAVIQEDANILEKILVSSCNIESPLHVAVSHGHLDFTTFLLNLKPELASEIDNLQSTALHLASANGDIEIVRALLEKNTSACLFRDLDGLIPLHCAVIRGNIDVIQELINARPPSVWTKLSNGQTVLHLCVKNSHLEATKMLVEILGIQSEEFFNTTDRNGNTILGLSMMLKQVEIVKYLLSIPGMKTGTSTLDSTSLDAIEEIPRPYSYNFGIQQTQNVQRERQRPELSVPTEEQGCWKALKKCLKYKGDWLQEVQGTMMLVATVIATVTFQGSINPPGSVWEKDDQFNKETNPAGKYYSCPNGTTFIAGTAIMAYQNHTVYDIYMGMNTISFSASVSVILLIISGFPLKNKICSWVLKLAMIVAVIFLVVCYLMGSQMVSYIPEVRSTGYGVYSVANGVRSLMFGAVFLCYIVYILIWMVKSLIRVSKCFFRIFTSPVPQLQP